MTYPPTRRVRTVRLRAPSHTLLKRGEILLEDALRTASIPAAETGGLLIVRSLHVGVIRSRRAPASLALAIERRLRRIRLNAVHADAAGAADQEAVYFHDDAEPYIFLARRIARGERPRAWFWPLAAPAWRPTMDRGEAMRTLFYGVTRTRARTGAGVRLFRELHEKSALPSLLTALQPSDGPRLMQTFGWKRPDVPTGAPAKRADEQLPGWETVLLYWTRQWGPGDLRSTLATCLALAAENPARLMDPGLPSRAGILLRTMAPKRESPVVPANKPVRSEKTDYEPFADNVSSATPAGVASAHEEDRARPLGLIEPRARRGDRRFDRAPRIPVSRDARPESQPAANEAREGAHAAESRQTTRKSDNPASFRPPERQPPVTKEKDSRPPARRWRRTDDPLPRRPTDYAGLFYLTPVLVRLGMAEFLKKSPRWIEYELPARFFLYICEILEIPPDDPIRSALEIRGNAEEQWQTDFAAPEAWSRGIMKGGSWMLQRMKKKPGVRILSDGSGNLVTAAWRREPPDESRTFIPDHPLKRGPVMPHEPILELALKAWLEAVHRWLRIHTTLELEEVVRRPGEIAVTPTHIDLFFPLDQVDIRIREGGLDIDPGWVPWLARVVYFHYGKGGRASDL